MSNEQGKTANAETNKPTEAQELTEKELESITGGGKVKEIILNAPVWNAPVYQY